MTTLLLFLSLGWDAVTRDCKGGLEHQPVRYQVSYALYFMRHSPVCPLTEDGQPQACRGRAVGMPVTEGTSLSLPEPAVGEVTAWEEPVSVDPAGNRSTECL